MDGGAGDGGGGDRDTRPDPADISLKIDAGPTACRPPEGPPAFTGYKPTMGIECDADRTNRCTPEFCTTCWQLASNDDSGCGSGTCERGGDCWSRVEFFCPESGIYNVFTRAYRSSETTTCTVASMPGTPH